MSTFRLVLRGLWFRRGVSLTVLIVASLVVGAAATGPLFLRAAGESVLRDSLAQALPSGRIVSDRVTAILASDPLAQVRQGSAEKLGSRPTLSRLLGPATVSLEVQTGASAKGATPETVLLVYRDDVCAHMHVMDGVCATKPGTATVSVGTLAVEGWRVGQTLEMNGMPVTVVGSYVPVEPTGDYWAAHPYFAGYSGSGQSGDSGSSLDAVFAPLATVQAQPGNQSGTGSTDRHLDLSSIRLTDVAALQDQVLSYTGGGMDGGIVNTSLGDVGDSALASVLGQATLINNALVLPVVVVEAQLLVLCWLVLFLLIGNAAEARGPEVALAKLRGLAPARTVTFGLIDTLVLVVLAVPAGFGLAWLLVAAITRVELAPSTPVVATSLGVWAAVGAGAGAAVAAVLAGSSTLRRPVMEQWRRATRRAKARPWLFDGIVVAGAAVGLVAMVRAGAVGSSAPNPLALIAPGLVVLAAALVGSRILPLLCRAAYEPTRNRGWTAALLAVRQLGRRPSTLRLALVVAVAFGLVTFGVDALAVARANAHDRAYTEVGAAEVLTVVPPAGQDVGDIVDRLDPSGTQAVAVSTSTDYTRMPSMLLMAAQPDRFARVAFWRPDFAAAPLADLTGQLRVASAPSVRLSGDRLRVNVDVTRLQAKESPILVADVAIAGNTSGTTAVTLGLLSPTTRTLEAALPCLPTSCRLAGLHLERSGSTLYPMSGKVTVTGMQVHAGGWEAVDADLTVPGGWQGTATGAPGADAAPGAAGLVLTANATLGQLPAWRVADSPVAVPALVSGSGQDTRSPSIAGLGGQTMTLAPVGSVSVLPGGGDRGVLVDRGYAQQAGTGVTTHSTETVWLTRSAADTFPDRLTAAGVTVVSAASADDLASLYQRQGPELAILLFLVGAVLAAVLAGGGAVLNLYLTGRRRTYEIAAMAALGVRRRTLFAALCAEQGLLMAFGIVVGAAAGLGAAMLALPAVPEFADAPTAPPLLYGVHPLPVLVSLVAAAVVLAVVTVASSANLVRASRFEQLREAAA